MSLLSPEQVNKIATGRGAPQLAADQNMVGEIIGTINQLLGEYPHQRVFHFRIYGYPSTTPTVRSLTLAKAREAGWRRAKLHHNQADGHALCLE